MALAEMSAGGSLWDMGNSMLGDGLKVWDKVEAIKANKASSGQDQYQAMTTVPLSNGAAIQVQAPIKQVGADDGSIVIMGTKINKGLLMFSGAIITTLVIIKAVR